MQYEYYVQNQAYNDYLDKQPPEVFRKYVGMLGRYSSAGSSVLDAGCGPGIALKVGQESYPDRLWQGAEISRASVASCRERGLRCAEYDGASLPFEDGSFAAVGSYNVLEHADDPQSFLDEQLRVLRDGGYLVVVCPNFLSVTNGYHHHTKGAGRKAKNILAILRRLAGGSRGFEKMRTIERPDFQPDDDACNVTNPLDILSWARLRGLTTEYWSARSVAGKSLANALDRHPWKIFLGSSFFVFRKPRTSART